MNLPLGITPNQVENGERKLRGLLVLQVTFFFCILGVAVAAMVLHSLGLIRPDLLQLTKVRLAPHHLLPVAKVQTSRGIGTAFLIDETTLVSSIPAVGNVAVGEVVKISFPYPNPEAVKTYDAVVESVPGVGGSSTAFVMKMAEPIKDHGSLTLSEVKLRDKTLVAVAGFSNTSNEIQVITCCARATSGDYFKLEPLEKQQALLDWNGYAVYSGADRGVIAVTTGGTTAIPLPDSLR